MVRYQVNVKVQFEIEVEWLDWMIKEHIPKVLKSGKLKSALILREFREDKKFSYFSILYAAKDYETLEDYRQNYSPALQQDSIEKFGDKFTASRAVFEEIIKIEH